MTLRTLIAGLLAGILAVAVVEAAPKKKSGSAAETPAPVPAAAKPADSAPVTASAARLRVWKGEFASKRTIQLLVHPSGKGTVKDLGNYEPGNRFGDYVDAPAGECTVEARLEGTTGAPLATYDTHFPAKVPSTLIVRETEDGTLHFEVIDDRPTGEDSSAELFVRNFVPALRTLDLKAGADLHVRLSTSGCYVHLRGLPRAMLDVKTDADDGSANRNIWASQVDLQQIQRATLVIVADAHGRIRPRFIVDGGSVTAAAAATAEPANPEANPPANKPDTEAR